MCISLSLYIYIYIYIYICMDKVAARLFSLTACDSLAGPARTSAAARRRPRGPCGLGPTALGDCMCVRTYNMYIYIYMYRERER